MPRIDPLQLLKCLSVLLGPHGGIKSPEDVARLVSLMSKFSKKLVSKCIYVQILQATTTSLLSQFMRQGGWELVSTWIIEAAAQGNGPLLEQLLALTLQSPLDVQQLQMNNCPRSVKALTRDAPTQRVQELAVVVVDAWVQMARSVKTEQAMPMQQQQHTYTTVMPTVMSVPMQQQQQQLPPQVQQPPSTVNHEYLQQQPDLPQHFVQPTMVQEIVPHVSEPVPMQVEVQHETMEQATEEEPVHHMIPQEVEMQEVPAEEIKMEEPAHEEEVEEEETGGSNGSAEENDQWDAPLGQLPVYKITIRDGKQVLAKVYSGEQRAQKPPSSNTVVIKIAKEQPHSEAEPMVTKQEDSAVPLKQEITPKAPRGPGRRKQLLKPIVSEHHETARTDVLQETDKKKGTVDKITARMAKEQAARRAERIQREKHKKLKEKLLERETKEKERKAKVQEEKDQETLARLLGANKVASVGKIPKKAKVDDDKDKKPEERKSELRRNSAEDERRKEKSKADIKGEVKKEKEEPKKGIPSVKSEHPTVKTEQKKDLHKIVKSSSPSTLTNSTINHSKIKMKSFNAKPRTTGLEEPIGPPPARGQSKKDKDKKPSLSLNISKKRVSPPPGKELLPPEKKQKPNTEEEEEAESAAAKPTSILSPKLKPKRKYRGG
ncbi:hypothetical protein B566_EDAN005199 [Ephemera danica]|nr:hypothetical protein B566_EDAN005199 [Ephemera danica]